jgi:hypothetical protein
VDQKPVHVPLNYPTSTLFIDESRARASGGRFFAIAAVKTRKPGELARALHDIRDTHSFAGEFKFKTVTRGSLPAYLAALDLLDSTDTQVHACVVDSEIWDPFRHRTFWKVHADIVTRLLVGSINRRELITATVDRISTPRDVAYDDVVKRDANRRLGATGVVGVTSIDSRCNDVLQLADLVAGSIAYDRGLLCETYRTPRDEKKKVAVRLKAALGGVDLNDGRNGRVNIVTYPRPARRQKAAGLRLVTDQRAG